MLTGNNSRTNHCIIVIFDYAIECILFYNATSLNFNLFREEIETGFVKKTI